jgi:hypothetical protein
MEMPPAAGESGQPNPAASTDAPASSRTDDEDFRRYAVARLADHLEVGVSLAQRCEQLAGVANGDRVAPITAAARLMNANARIAEALATMAQLERRRRSIVERIQPVENKNAELNSGFGKFRRSDEFKAEEKEKLWKRMNEMCNETLRARMGDPASRDVIMEKIKEARWDHAKAQETLAKLDQEAVRGA